jgi:phage baseplate assembly protein W|tara:strand:- start:306 stop:707 length:402 start_codon:yes stop_codon:yes gene_type:complete
MPLYGPKWPLKAGNADTFELYNDINQQISFYLKNLLLTSPGENISDSSYGVGLRRFMFEPNLPSIRSSIAGAISSQISEYLPYLTVEDIQVNASAQEIDNNSLKVRIIYSIPNDAAQQIFELDLNPDTTTGLY